VYLTTPCHGAQRNTRSSVIRHPRIPEPVARHVLNAVKEQPKRSRTPDDCFSQKTRIAKTSTSTSTPPPSNALRPSSSVVTHRPSSVVDSTRIPNLSRGNRSDPEYPIPNPVIFRAIMVHMLSPKVDHLFSPKLVHRFSPKVVHSFSPKLGQGDIGETPSSGAYFLLRNKRAGEERCLERGRRPWTFEKC
jgi:hypothetical protein